MKEISTIQEAEEYISSYNWYEAKARDQEMEYNILRNCEALALEHQQIRLLCSTRVYLTSYFTQVNDLQAALEIGLPNYELAQREGWVDEYLKMLSFLITIYQLLGNYSQSEIYINLCKDHVYQLNDLKKICNIHIVSANQYFYTGDLAKCIESHKMALSYATRLNDTYALATIYNNYGFHLIESDPEESLQVLNTGLELIQNEPGAKQKMEYLLAYFHLNFANLYVKLKMNDACIGSAIRAVKLFGKHQLQVEKLDAQIILAKGLLNTGKYTRCKSLLTEIEQIAAASSANRILLKCYRIMYEMLEKRGRFREAYHTLHRYLDTKEMIYNEESNQKIRNLQISHEVKSIKMERENAEAMARLKHDFLANMSHEIRTPVNSILGISYLLQRDAVSEKQADYLQRLQRNGENLLAIINDVLDISKIEAGKLELLNSHLDVSAVIQDVCDMLQLKAEDKGIGLYADVKPNVPKQLTGDPARLKQILINLTTNAIKFTPQGSVTINAELSRNTGQHAWIQFSVRDTGIGMSTEALERVFDRYEQANAGTQVRHGGTGLGLAISRKLAELMQGSITVNSTEGNGTEFFVNIPFYLSMDTEVSVEKGNTDLTSLSGKHILIADDVEDNRKVLRDILQLSIPGIQIQEAVNGIEVLDILRTEIPDLIMMDLDMPELNGFETTAKIRELFKDHKIGIIAHTASLLTMPKSEILALGFDALLQKPFRPNELFQLLQIVLK